MFFRSTLIAHKTARKPYFMGLVVLKEIIIWNKKRHTKPQKPRVSGVFLYPLISLGRPDMWWEFL